MVPSVCYPERAEALLQYIPKGFGSLPWLHLLSSSCRATCELRHLRSLPEGFAHAHYFVYFRFRLNTPHRPFVKPLAECQTAWIRMRRRVTRRLIRIQAVCLCYITRGKAVNGLTLYSTGAHFSASIADDFFKILLEKKNAPFSTMFSKPFKIGVFLSSI